MSRKVSWPAHPAASRKPTPPPGAGAKPPVTVSLWDSEQRRYTVVRADLRGVELVGPANTVVLGEETVLGIGFAGGDIFVCLRIIAIAPGRTNPKLARIKAQWRTIWGTDQVLTKRFFTERLRVPAGIFKNMTALPTDKMMDRITTPNPQLGRTARRLPSRPASKRLNRPRTLKNPYRRSPVTTSGHGPVRRSTRP